MEYKDDIVDSVEREVLFCLKDKFSDSFVEEVKREWTTNEQFTLKINYKYEKFIGDLKCTVYDEMIGILKKNLKNIP